MQVWWRVEEVEVVAIECWIKVRYLYAQGNGPDVALVFSETVKQRLREYFEKCSGK